MIITHFTNSNFYQPNNFMYKIFSQLEDVAVTHHEGINGDYLHIQVSIHHNSIIRVLNRRIRVTERINKVAMTCDEDIVLCMIGKKASLLALKHNSEKARAFIDGEMLHDFQLYSNIILHVDSFLLLHFSLFRNTS